MANSSLSHLAFYVEVLLKLAELDVPYAIIGGFAATIFGITRVTYDIDIVVDLKEEHIQSISDAFPSPPYYADPYQMRNAMNRGMSFNIIDGSRGEKVDLFPITMDERYRPALENRIRRRVEPNDGTPFEIWVARPEDVIAGKLMAWQEGRSTRQTDDIYEMMLFHFLENSAVDSFDYESLDRRASEIGDEAGAMWRFLRDSARETANRNSE